MSVRDSDDSVMVNSKTASDKEVVNVRYIAAVKERDPMEGIPEEERGDLGDVELNYV